MAADSDGDTAADLRERVRELEDQVSTQQDLLQKMMPKRRDVLAGLAGGGLGVAGLLAASGPAAAADTSTAELGAAGASWDVFVDELKDPQGDNLVDVDDTGILQWQRGFDVPELVTEALRNNGVLTTRQRSKNKDIHQPIETTTQLDWTDFVELTHGGDANQLVVGNFDGAVGRLGGVYSWGETGNILQINQDFDWGATGSTVSISTHLRFKVDDSDASVAYLQADLGDDDLIGAITGTLAYSSDVTIATVPIN